ncbi:hypothetical protein OsI_01760 [Oryza sativa Indica Group]|uniref:Uncharacterized protein n=2 Tax=Oryza sativa TaxID=4530 RepID=B9EW91_ORYSJ|nr:hypothetical protein OsI_01760 [Oryza sativa Indica Group]EEE54496.1 hypothetical protein OsJ_01618 [Oryza sativa Japonica Group]
MVPGLVPPPQMYRAKPMQAAAEPMQAAAEPTRVVLHVLPVDDAGGGWASVPRCHCSLSSLRRRGLTRRRRSYQRRWRAHVEDVSERRRAFFPIAAAGTSGGRNGAATKGRGKEGTGARDGGDGGERGKKDGGVHG